MKYHLFIFIVIVSGCNAAKHVRTDQAKPHTAQPWNLPLAGGGSLPMVWIPAGIFTMGSSDTETGRKADEGPLTHVTLSKGFWLGKTEVTVGQWKAVMGETLRDHVMAMLKDETVYDFGGQQKKLRGFMNFNPADPDRIMANEYDELPMYFVSWDDATNFCKRLNTSERSNDRLPDGYEYALPTEAQWEYACRAGTTTATFNTLDSIAWYAANSKLNYTGRKLGNSGAGPRNAGEKKSNAWGLQDMPGNLWEWCSDTYGPYPGGNVTDPTGPAAGVGKVNRGGSWGSGANSERSAARASNPQPEKSAYRGFRVALRVIP